MTRVVVTGGSGKAGRAVVADVVGADVFIIAVADTAMDRPNAELMAECFPSVPLRESTGTRQTLLSIDKARRVLGYDPAHSWHDVLAGQTEVAHRGVEGR